MMNHEPSSMTLSDEERRLLGLWAADCAERVLPLFEAKAPSDTRPREAIEAIRAEMSSIGRWLADRHEFAYPHELEDIVRRVWNEHKEALTRR